MDPVPGWAGLSAWQGRFFFLLGSFLEVVRLKLRSKQRRLYSRTEEEWRSGNSVNRVTSLCTHMGRGTQFDLILQSKDKG